MSYLECHDSGHIDCATTGQFVNMCGDKDRAKQECRHFCGLCSLGKRGTSGAYVTVLVIIKLTKNPGPLQLR